MIYYNYIIEFPNFCDTFSTFIDTSATLQPPNLVFDQELCKIIKWQKTLTNKNQSITPLKYICYLTIYTCSLTFQILLSCSHIITVL